MKYLLFAVLILAACGKEASQIEQLKCDETVYINQQNNKVTWVSGQFEHACKRNADGTISFTWNKLVRSERDNTCGFWVQDDGSLVTYKNKELTLNPADWARCETYP